VEALARTADIARDEEAFWDAYLRPLSRQCIKLDGERVQIEIEHLRRMPPAVARRLLRRALQQVGEATGAPMNSPSPLRAKSEASADFGHIQAVLDLALCGQSGKVISLPRGVRAAKVFSTLSLEPASLEPTSLEPASLEPADAPLRFVGYVYGVQPPCVLSVPEIPGSFHFELISLPPDRARYNETESELLDCGLVDRPLLLRSWRPGDAYRRSGHRKARKIKELFQREHIPAVERQRWPVVAAGDQIVWTRRWGIAEGFAPPPGSEQALRIREIVGQ
jgi:tRNA(Ile)-lysidine synthase